MKYIILFFLLPLFSMGQTAQVKGVVTSTGMPVPGASIYLLNTNFGITSNSRGEFSLRIPTGTHILIVSSIGYTQKQREITVKEGEIIFIDFNLETAEELLNEVIVKQPGLGQRTPYNTTVVNFTGVSLKGNTQGIMGNLKMIPGLAGAEFGQSIAKPFIRGLGFSRIVTLYQGNKLENHQWGADHGLGVNDLGISRVEIIKGPASLLYGSGALGGVLLTYDDEFYLKQDNWTGNIGHTFNSTSNGIRGYASIGKKFPNDMFFATDLGHETHGDYEDGNNRLIGNSRFKNSTVRVHSGIEKESFKNKFTLTYNIQQLGIINEDEMQDGHSLATTRQDRNLQLPYQEVEDILISYNQSTARENIETTLHVSHHINIRKEIETSPQQVDLGLNQSHTFFNGTLRFPGKQITHTIGLQGSLIKNLNMRKALDVLIPDATVVDAGAFYLAGLETNSWFFQGGLRFDHRRVKATTLASHFSDRNFQLPNNPSNAKLSRYFKGFTGSVGVSKSLNTNQIIKLNLSTGFRAPDLAELFSNGPHPGTSRFEQGNLDFDREQNFQVDLNYTYKTSRFKTGISIFTSIIDNYVIFEATGERHPHYDLDLWAYRQKPALFRGMELEASFLWLQDKRLETLITGAIVRAREKNSSQPLSFIPADNITINLNYFALANKSATIFTGVKFVADQNRPGPYEEETPGYTLVNAGLSKNFVWNRRSLDAGVTIHNAFNRNYVDHLSILRAFNVSSPGRNIMLNLRYNF